MTTLEETVFVPKCAQNHELNIVVKTEGYQTGLGMNVRNLFILACCLKGYALREGGFPLSTLGKER